MGANLILPAGSAAAASTTADPVTRSLRFEGSAYLSKTFSGSYSSGTFSFWFKRANLGEWQRFFRIDNNGSSYHILSLNSSDQLHFQIANGSSGYITFTSTAKFRDTAAWYHCAVVYDSSGSSSDVNGSANSKIRIYINGDLIEGSESVYSTNPLTSDTFLLPSSSVANFYWGKNSYNNNYYFRGYVADVIYVDGSAVNPVGNFISLGDYKNYVPKAFDMSSHSGNSFHLKFEDSSDIGADSANSNDFTATNLASHDVMPDVPYSKNYATLNPLDIKNTVSSTSEGNLKLTGYFSTYYPRFVGTIGVNSGKWYWEVCKIGTSTSWANEAGVKAVNTPSPG
jgi:hypothetical protein